MTFSSVIPGFHHLHVCPLGSTNMMFVPEEAAQCAAEGTSTSSPLLLTKRTDGMFTHVEMCRDNRRSRSDIGAMRDKGFSVYGFEWLSMHVGPCGFGNSATSIGRLHKNSDLQGFVFWTLTECSPIL